MLESFPRKAHEAYETPCLIAPDNGHVGQARCRCHLARGTPRSSNAVYVKVLAATVAAYALSPVDLIPDFIPVLGYLDDLLLVPVGILLVVRMIPADLLHEFRQEALRARRQAQKPRRCRDSRWHLVAWRRAIAVAPLAERAHDGSGS